MYYTVVIPGEPKGKQRPRVTKRGIAYTPKETVEYERFTKKCFEEQNPEYKVLGNPVRASITCYYSIPKSASKNKAEQMRKGIIRPTKKPDTDNVAKMVLDALNKIAYKDDSQVVELNVIKFYGDTPLVKLLIAEL